MDEEQYSGGKETSTVALRKPKNRCNSRTYVVESRQQ